MTEEIKEQKDFYKKNPTIIMYFAVGEDGNVQFDYDEEKVDVTDAMLLAHNTVNEFLKTISEKIKSETSEQEKINTEKTGE